jgi:hypothetical protein
LRSAESGTRGVFPVSGLRIKLVRLDKPVEGKDLNRNHRIDPWEFDRLVEVRTLDGKLLQDGKLYTLALPDFLVGGGDDFDWVMAKIPAIRIHREGFGLMRDELAEYIRSAGPLNTVDRPLVDPNNPRLTFVENKAESRKSKGGGSRHRRARSRASAKG